MPALSAGTGSFLAVTDSAQLRVRILRGLQNVGLIFVCLFVWFCFPVNTSIVGDWAASFQVRLVKVTPEVDESWTDRQVSKTCLHDG